MELPSLNLVDLKFPVVQIWLPIFTVWYTLPSKSLTGAEGVERGTGVGVLSLLHESVKLKSSIKPLNMGV
jgi:hypothetical protein